MSTATMAATPPQIWPLLDIDWRKVERLRRASALFPRRPAGSPPPMTMNPPTECALNADRNVVASWIRGWGPSRGVAARVQVYNGFRVDVGLPDQKARYLFAEASSGVERISREIAEPNVFIKVCAPPEAVEPLLASGWSIGPVDFMM